MVAQLLAGLTGGSAAAAGGGAAGSAIPLIGPFVDRFSKNLDDVIEKVSRSQNIAANIDNSDVPITPRIQEAAGAGGAFVNELPKLAETIIKQSGLEELIKDFKKQSLPEPKEKKDATPTKENEKSTPTQGTNTPVGEAKQQRDEGRSNVEQLFLDLINGNLQIKP